MSASANALQQLHAQIGKDLGSSDWVLVDQAMIDRFAEVSGDHQWIHLDAARAKETRFGGTIAHGFLTLSLASRFVQDALTPLKDVLMSVNYGFDRLRFLSPVPAGSRVRGRFVLEGIQRRDATSLLRTLGLTIELEGSDKPALAGSWLGLAIFAD
ncbi:MaoC family dehydratase [Paracoccus sediminicola]|uniref:MaoC family dehydratase n=1 Tax=Paracoccus sediminicola TaxID=3017783 RepID=UPI0022F0F3FE|nr:MaoC family dehydratase [Paracoccus sediminicola]WBU56165.1 MaoC family dehydratase [Paracoccus sediminicola]